MVSSVSIVNQAGTIYVANPYSCLTDKPMRIVHPEQYHLVLCMFLLSIQSVNTGLLFCRILLHQCPFNWYVLMCHLNYYFIFCLVKYLRACAHYQFTASVLIVYSMLDSLNRKIYTVSLNWHTGYQVQTSLFLNQ